ncbi:hypothetical protein BACINT_00451 [Bacteroides intestinalis DSM 17393]|uniref:Uncharacterized protein n=1 Tax=Bacteroides intestinalis DSM 17393 TaxID=471870 RepID=B3C6B7_9BACE|nr:hypothetical protein BACINT_00451 [Bacteroides intestinalis DSM 17393]EEO59023.1 hypothetical protein BSCG_08005 [Bacteroides sp. 2_2_4]
MCSGCAWEQKPDKREKDTRHNKKSSVGERCTARGCTNTPDECSH